MELSRLLKPGSRTSVTTLAFVALYGTCVSGALDGLCPPLGAVLPPPTSPSSHPAVQSASALLRETLGNLTAPFHNTAISFGIQSIHEPEPVVEFHYTPPELDARGVQGVDSDTVYRLASTSKIFPVLAILKTHGMRLDDPITDYLPELRTLNEQAEAQNAIWTVDWDEITLGALASHQGTPADLIFDMASDPNSNFSSLGFPPAEEYLLLNCSIAHATPCESHVFWDLFGRRPPAFPLFSNPVYSNVGFALLGWAVEKVTNVSFADYVKEKIWDPTGMHHTFATRPDDKLGVIPKGTKWWDATIGFESAAGEYYSSLSDMLTFGVSILSNKQLSPAKTRRWLKPLVSTSQSGLQVGAPWEVYRATNITSDGRLIEIYSKMGNIKDYNSLLVLIPDYDLVVDILIAGTEASGSTLLTIITTTLKDFLPALEQAGKDNARRTFTGTYVDTVTNSSLRLSLDDENPGISVTNWTVRGVSILETPESVDPASIREDDRQNQTKPVVRYRIYPSRLETDTQSAWRGVRTEGTPEKIAEAESKILWPMSECITWAQMDRVQYALKSTDHFVFNVTKQVNGIQEATTVELPAYRVTLKRELGYENWSHEEQKVL